MQSPSALEIVRDTHPQYSAPSEPHPLRSGGDPSQVPQTSANSSPFFQQASAERRLNLSEKANELSPCPEEVLEVAEFCILRELERPMSQ